MADPVARSAARVAALVALPVALLVGVGTFVLLRAAAAPEPAAPSPSATPVVTTPVEMAAPSLTDREEIVCRALLSQLPPALDGLAQRPVTAGPEQNTAYGEPAVTLACGGPEPTYEPTDQLHPWQGVCWHPAEGPEGSVWTVLGREVPVRVSVPVAYDGAFQLVLQFSRPVAQTVRSAGELPSGCRE